MEKRDEIGSMFEECNLDILGLSETKLGGRESLVLGGKRFQIWGAEKGKCERGSSSSDGCV